MKISIAIRSIIGDWLHHYWPTLVVLPIIGLIMYFTYRFIYIRKINKILKKEEKPKKLLPIEYFTFITLIFTILSTFVGIGVDNYIHRDIKINMSTNLLDLNIRSIYEQLDEYSSKDKKIKISSSFSFSFNVDNNYEIIEFDGKGMLVYIPKLNKYTEYSYKSYESNIITFYCRKKDYHPSTLNYWIDFEKYYEKFDRAVEFLINLYIENKETSYTPYYSIRFGRFKKEVTFEKIKVLNENGVDTYEKFTYSGKFINIYASNPTDTFANNWYILIG